MSEFFMPPDDLQLDELTNATLMKLEQFRDRTATGQLQTTFYLCICKNVLKSITLQNMQKINILQLKVYLIHICVNAPTYSQNLCKKVNFLIYQIR